MYRLTKVAIDVGQLSHVFVGEQASGEVLRVRKEVGGEFKELGSLWEVEQGDEVFILRSITSFIKTSPVSKILERTDNYVKFKTSTSTYELTKE